MRVLSGQPQSGMVTTKMIISPSPFQVQAQGVGVASQRPSAVRQWGQMFAQGEIDAHDIGSHDFASQVDGLQGGSQLFTATADSNGVQIFESIANLDLVELPIQQLRIDLSGGPALTWGGNPLPEMRGQGVRKCL